MICKDNSQLSIYCGGVSDLPQINEIIRAAVDAWPLPARLRRLTTPLLEYKATDSLDLEFLIARVATSCHTTSQTIPVGVAAWDFSNVYPGPGEYRSALLHGLYVTPHHQRHGVGCALQQATYTRALAKGRTAMVVKAERVSESYFQQCGYHGLSSNELGIADYPYLYWHPINARDHSLVSGNGYNIREQN